jgi:RNA polymerase sigma-70 factor, ECF subfamily
VTTRDLLDSIYREESGRIRATLIRLLGDFEVAEDAMQDAFVAAAEQWRHDGVPQNPRAYLISTARFKAIDTLRRRSRFDTFDDKTSEHPSTQPDLPENEFLEDDRLRLIFTCCHPSLAPEGRIALTLREVCGLATEEIARAFLIGPAALAQRIVRAKARIKELHVPYEVPTPTELPQRLNTVLQVIYLVFNEGYYASSGASLTRTDLSAEAIRLGRMIRDLLPEPEATGPVFLA